MEQAINRRDYAVSKLEEHIKSCLSDLGQDILLSKRQYSNHGKRLEEALEKADSKEEELLAINGDAVLTKKKCISDLQKLGYGYRMDIPDRLEGGMLRNKEAVTEGDPYNISLMDLTYNCLRMLSEKKPA